MSKIKRLLPLILSLMLLSSCGSPESFTLRATGVPISPNGIDLYVLKIKNVIFAN